MFAMPSTGEMIIILALVMLMLGKRWSDGQ
jgi:hypothetical protein